MDQLGDEESFLDELMSSQRREDAAPAELWHSSSYPGPQGGMMMMSDLLFYGADDDMDVAAPFEDLPLPAPPGGPREEFSFDCLSEVCNPYRSRVGFVSGAEAAAAGRALTDPLHDAMEEDEMSRDKAHVLGDAGGGSSSLCPAPFVFGSGGCAGGPSSVSMTGASGVRHRSKLHGAIPSKNLMAERRRRKRLNDRLSMLRSIVPRISKMDRTSILGDTIDYVNELTERIKVLEEEIGAAPEDLNLLNTIKDFSSGCSEMPARNSTKFGVEKQGDGGTRIEMCCPANPGVLLSTLSALEALGLEIEQCVASCFSDFGMQASCLQVEGKRQGISTDDEIKQALFRSAGYGGRCL